MSLRNPTCQKFERLVNDEIAAGQQFDFLKVDALRNQIITREGKQALGYSLDQRLTLYEIVKPSVDVLPKLRFIYLLSLIEAFGEEYIAERDPVPLGDVRRHLSAQQSRWQKLQQGVLSSTSFLNLAYLAFVLRDKYAIDFTSVKNPCFWEAGVLRNCLVHHNGVVPDEAFRLGLTNCIAETGVPDSVGTKMIVTAELLWTYIEDTRRFLRACDY
jgi:hypothetical protein